MSADDQWFNVCRNCDGKGHVLDGAATLVAFMSVLLAPLALLERRNPNGITRQRCEVCDGAGRIRGRK